MSFLEGYSIGQSITELRKDVDDLKKGNHDILASLESLSKAVTKALGKRKRSELA